jgi:hypothetical protein
MARRMIKAFTYQSEVGANGRGRWFLPGVPKRDLDAKDIARLSDEDYEAVKSAKQPNGDKLYVRSDNSDDDDDEPSSEPQNESEEVVTVEELEAENAVQDDEAQREADEAAQLAAEADRVG